LTTSGNVGIGVSPVTALDVHSAGTEVASAFGMADDGNVWVTTRVGEVQDRYGAYSFMVGSNAVDGVGSANCTAYIASYVKNNGGALQGDLQFHTNAGDNLGSPKLTIEAGGNATFSGAVIHTGNTALGGTYTGYACNIYGSNEVLAVRSSNITMGALSLRVNSGAGNGGTSVLYLATKASMAGDENLANGTEPMVLAQGSRTLHLGVNSTSVLALDSSSNATFAAGVYIRTGSDVGSYFDSTNTNTLNFGYHENSVTGGWVNYKGYQGGTTQFRDFYIGDGKNAQVAYFKGSDKSATFAGTIGSGAITSTGKIKTATTFHMADGSNYNWELKNSGSTLLFYENQVVGHNAMTLSSSGALRTTAGMTVDGNLVVSGTGSHTFAGAIIQSGGNTYAHFGSGDSDSRLILGSQGGTYAGGTSTTNGHNNFRAHSGGMIFNVAGSSNTFVFEHGGVGKLTLSPTLATFAGAVKSTTSAKAWVNYNHYGAAVRDSYNISSVTDISTGIARYYFDVDLANINYTAFASSSGSYAGNVTGSWQDLDANSPAVYNYAVGSIYTAAYKSGYRDFDWISVIAFGD
jgi:hypothetical protein